MLGKVMKHEVADTGKVMLPLALALLGCGLLGTIVLRTLHFDDEFGPLIFAGVYILYVLAGMALTVAALVYLCVRFYKSMFGSESYLTHTLPVSGNVLFHGKLLVAAGWQFINFLLVFGMAFVMGFALGYNVGGSGPESMEMKEFVQEFSTVMGFEGTGFVLGIIGFMLLSAFAGLIAVYACMAVGQLFEKHKILAFAVSYVILYLVEQVVATVTMVVTTTSGELVTAAQSLESSNTTFMDLYGTMMSSTLVESLIFTIICYLTALYICNKKLNIE